MMGREGGREGGRESDGDDRERESHPPMATSLAAEERGERESSGGGGGGGGREEGSGDDFGRLDTAAASRSSLRTCTRARERGEGDDDGGAFRFDLSGEYTRAGASYKGFSNIPKFPHGTLAPKPE